jgi:hypothetical protein
MNEIQFKRKKLLTRPVLKFIENQPVYVKLEEPIYVGRELKADLAPDGTKKKEPAHLANVIDLRTGELAQIIVAAVVLSVLNEEYPNSGYVGRCFAITKKGKAPGKQYFGYNVEEIEDPTAQPSAKEETESSAASGRSRARPSGTAVA